MLPLTGWSYCKKITVQTAYLDAALTDFPLIVFIDADTDIGGHALASGYDIRFTTSDGTTLLSYERRSFAIAAGAATGRFVVKTSLATSPATDIYIHYGNATAPDVSSGPDAYDANFKFVAPLDEAYGTGAGNYVDRKGGHNLTLTDADSDSSQVDGPITKAVNLSGDADYLKSVVHADFDPGGAMTIEGWGKFDNLPSVNTDFASANPAYCVWSIRAQTIDEGTQPRTFVYTPPGFPTLNGSANYMTTGNWYYLVKTYDRTLVSNRLKLYFQGALDQQGDGNDADIAPANDGLYVGKANDFMDGAVAEIRLSHIARSAAWVKFTRYNITEADHEATWGAEESATTTLVIQEATHALSVDGIILIENKTLVIQEAIHSLVSDPIILLQQHILFVAEATHGLTVDSITLTQVLKTWVDPMFWASKKDHHLIHYSSNAQKHPGVKKKVYFEV